MIRFEVPTSKGTIVVIAPAEFSDEEAKKVGDMLGRLFPLFVTVVGPLAHEGASHDPA